MRASRTKGSCDGGTYYGVKFVKTIYLPTLYYRTKLNVEDPSSTLEKLISIYGQISR